MDFDDSSSSSSSKITMDFDDSSSSSSSCNPSTICSTSTSPAPGPSPTRKAGRKKFRETQHPVYHGVRERNGGRWVCEVREPRRKGRIWLGTFPTPEMAARAHDVAAIALRGSSAQLNFPDSAWALPRAKSAAPDDVRRAAADAAATIPPSNSLPPSSTALPAAGITPPGRDGVEAGAAAEASEPPPAPVFVDEEALFNMPGLLEDMARGLLVTPPSMLEGFDRDGVDECLMDLSLW
ncbi:AP2 ERF domain-containing transcription factor [Musa troglodytarum]|uniref:AP2 ERF domain-containing transcription factor n=1 Tax=Musa troglodytarum TaxID=320322 RepID=A0A9E7JJZ4_9LILI|nr:AP2 ERF domain-containing transcription factor [Musa troglodytarum]